MRLFTAIKVLFSKDLAEKLKNTEKTETQDNSAQILGLFQRDGRLIDFLQEDISQFSDEQVGAAVRDVHKGCAQVLKEYFEIEPVIEKKENSKISVEPDFDKNTIKIIGNVPTKEGKKGILRHHGWKLAESKLPPSTTEKNNIIQKAQIEIE